MKLNKHLHLARTENIILNGNCLRAFPNSDEKIEKAFRKDLHFRLTRISQISLNKYQGNYKCKTENIHILLMKDVSLLRKIK